MQQVLKSVQIQNKLCTFVQMVLLRIPRMRSDFDSGATFPTPITPQLFYWLSWVPLWRCAPADSRIKHERRHATQAAPIRNHLPATFRRKPTVDKKKHYPPNDPSPESKTINCLRIIE